jgi:hypothetical protein
MAVAVSGRSGPVTPGPAGTAALKYIPNPMDVQLEGLFNMLKGFGSVATITLVDGVYYNCSYLMIKGAKAATGTFKGLHNILVTKQSNLSYYYNSNERTPKWSVVSEWKLLERQNDADYSYVFSGVCVEMRRK